MLDIRIQNTNSKIESKRTTYKKHFTTSKTCIDEIKTLFGILIQADALKNDHFTSLEMWDAKNKRMW